MKKLGSFLLKNAFEVWFGLAATGSVFMGFECSKCSIRVKEISIDVEMTVL